MEDLLRVGIITSTHGIAGEVKVFPTTDDVSRFSYLKECILKTDRGEILNLNVCGVKYFKNMVILKFKEFNNINQIEKYRNADLFVTRDNAVKLEEGEYFICDLIGLKVIDENDCFIGCISDVLQTGANDVYEVTAPDGKEYLFPVIKECILNVDPAKGEVRVHIMKGLLDL